MFDPADDLHARALARLESEQVAWLGTIGRDGYPHAVPIWFLWRDGRALIMSEPSTVKVRNLRANDRVDPPPRGGRRRRAVADPARHRGDLAGAVTAEWLDSIGDRVHREVSTTWMQRLGIDEAESMAERYSVGHRVHAAEG